MQFTCERDALIKALDTALKAVPTKTTMPVLQGVVIEAKNEKVKLTTNDMNLGIETTVEAYDIESGIVCIEAKTLSNIVKKLQNKPVTVITTDRTAEIRCGKSDFELSVYQAEEFPKISKMSPTSTIEIDGSTLQAMIGGTVFAVSDNQQNKILTGELFEIKNNKLRIVALDMVRVAIRQVELAYNAPDVKVVIPAKTLISISKSINSETVKIEFDKNYVRFTTGDAVFTSRLIEGNFFNIDQMLNRDFETEVCVDSDELADALERATIIDTGSNKEPTVFEIKDYSMNLRKVSTTSKFNEDVDVEKSGKDIRIGLNPSFILDVLKATGETETRIKMFNDKSPVYIMDDYGEYVYLILPINI